MDTDPPFRNFTLRLYAKLLVDLHPPGLDLATPQKRRLVQAYRNAVYSLKRVVLQMDPALGVNEPFYFLLEQLQRETARFSPADSPAEFNRMLAQPLLMCPFLTPELQQKLPPLLHAPCVEDESQNAAQLVQDLLLKRHLLGLFAPTPVAASFDLAAKLDYGFAGALAEDELVSPLPPDRTYQVCYLRQPGKHALEQLYLMLDENFLILLRPTAQSPTRTKAQVFLKRKFKYVFETMLDKADSRNLFLAVSKSTSPCSLAEECEEVNVYFEDWRKCLEVRDFQIEDKRRRQLQREKDLLEQFLVEVCEQELIM